MRIGVRIKESWPMSGRIDGWQNDLPKVDSPCQFQSFGPPTRVFLKVFPTTFAVCPPRRNRPSPNTPPQDVVIQKFGKKLVRKCGCATLRAPYSLHCAFFGALAA